MNRLFVFLGAMVFAVYTSMATSAYSTLSDVVMTQNPNTKDVTVTYKVSSSDSEALYVMLDIVTNNVSIGREQIKTFLSDSDISDNGLNDLVSATATPTTKKIVWKAKRDWPGHLATDAEARVTVLRKNEYYHIPGIYMSVNIGHYGNDPTIKEYYSVAYSFSNPTLSGTSFYLWGAGGAAICFKRVEPGEFMMGGSNGRKVKITKPFFMGLTELTDIQIAKLMTHSIINYYVPTTSLSYQKIRGVWSEQGGDVGTNSLLAAIRQKTSLPFDLPTEAQWEYVCRAGTATDWNSGHDMTGESSDVYLDELGWYKANSKNSSNINVSHNIGSKKANAWGFYDMHGNAAEWCLDGYQADLLTVPTEDPCVSGNVDSGSFVVRGGNYNSGATSCTSQARDSKAATIVDNTCGVRLVCVIPE